MRPKKTANSSNQQAFLYVHRLTLVLLLLLSCPLLSLASYHGDPWLGRPGKSSLQEILWSWNIPQSWLDGPTPQARIFLTHVMQLQQTHLKFLVLPPPPDERARNVAWKNTLGFQPQDPRRMVDPKLVSRWFAHASLLAAPWGKNKNLSPISPGNQLVWVQPTTTTTEDYWTLLLANALRMEPGLSPAIIHSLWDKESALFGALIDSQPEALWPVHVRGLASVDATTCERAMVVPIAETSSVTIGQNVPACTADLTSGIAQTAALDTDGKTPVFLTDPWVLQTVLAGSLGHLVSLQPGRHPAFYVHALRATARDDREATWSFGRPQLAQATHLLLHDSPMEPVKLPPRRVGENTLLLATLPTPVLSAQVTWPPAKQSLSHCRGTPTGAVRCVIQKSLPLTKDSPPFRVLVSTKQESGTTNVLLTWAQAETTP